MCNSMINTVCVVDSRVVCRPILQTDRVVHQQMFDITSTIQSTFNVPSTRLPYSRFRLCDKTRSYIYGHFVGHIFIDMNSAAIRSRYLAHNKEMFNAI